mmetsp:Transcript_106550/g.243966  ORF Transcript_106550/g.243966 Transcript_106550/m.243966 type:complete len:155 (-) Transcript_106550:139-603(-)
MRTIVSLTVGVLMCAGNIHHQSHEDSEEIRQDNLALARARKHEAGLESAIKGLTADLERDGGLVTPAPVVKAAAKKVEKPVGPKTPEELVMKVCDGVALLELPKPKGTFLAEATQAKTARCREFFSAGHQDSEGASLPPSHCQSCEGMRGAMPQ